MVLGKQNELVSTVSRQAASYGSIRVARGNVGIKNSLRYLQEFNVLSYEVSSISVYANLMNTKYRQL